MPLYRLDYLDPDSGLPSHAVRTIVGDYLGRRFDRAREEAIRCAAIDPQPTSERRAVLVTKIEGAGAMTPAIIAHPDGKVTRA